MTAIEPRTLPPTSARPLDWELLVCTHVLGLSSLHWGLWNPDTPVTLDGLREAQDRYTELVLATLPSSAQSALDVGCGTGDLAARLASRGCAVTAIAPVANYEQRLSSNGNSVAWRRSRLQDLDGVGPFDAVLMIESAGYFPIRDGLKKARELLNPAGHLLVANPFRKRPVDIEVARHTLAEYMSSASEAGFELVSERDITESVLPTLDLVRQFRRAHLEPAASLVRFAAERSRPVRLGLGLGSVLFRKRIATIRSKLRIFREQLDPDLFREHARYMILLFRKSA